MDKYCVILQLFSDRINRIIRIVLNPVYQEKGIVKLQSVFLSLSITPDFLKLKYLSSVSYLDVIVKIS